MHQNVVALHAANGMLDKDAHTTQGGIGRLWLIASWRVRVLFALVRLPRRDVNLITPGVGLPAKRASIDPHIDLGKPIQLRRKLLFSHAVIMMRTTKRPPEKDNAFVRQGPDRMLQRRLFFSPWNAHVVWHHRWHDGRLVRWHP